ncbi:hypothetical protein M8756_05100 [Lutimaribacter sp. EGI FJ00015]|uniref:Uncharacterized protein n=1 Tax=Lutimaribacter degradans TaxID=2945989 RepID=A0ACC5ZW46_9RHOB|nr:hypothetical protein [Lutimaribacter sp. EGI FJ00013]MCM2561614.1 hypothetical protein [Lutimaribacter sp. EGI FJ00013]MCO0612675.1 hypothetical protein [Lutimaribacter sp. EGI FJ00015]MCO0635333.1 hypothetical protein [Lutimaribacter sp. EGI FJ00014]
MADPVADILDPGETLRATFRPSFRIYLQRELFVVVLTAVAFAPLVLYLDEPRAWVILPLVMLVDLFVFDNLGDWRRNRTLNWVLTDKRLLQVDTQDPLGLRALPIAEIARLRRLMWWRLFVVGEEREIIEIAYVRGLPALRHDLARLREGTA